MRQKTGCKSCRHRHVKCVQRSDSDKCKECHKRSWPCIRSQKYRFRPVTSVKFNTRGGNGLVVQELKFAANQAWVHTPSTLRFVSLRPDQDDTDISASDLDDSPISIAIRDISLQEQDRASLLHESSLTTHSFAAVPKSPTVDDICNKITFPFILTSSPTLSTTSPSSYTRWPFSAKHEARLFHHYVVHISPLIDVCDSKRHFGKEVPRRAANFPIILNSILAVASRHLYLLEQVDQDLSQPYVDECLSSLIIALEDPIAPWDENLLTAVILLRLHEEMGDDDNRTHHFGSTHLLNSISSFASDGGLRESASWVSLRQHFYVSLTTQQPFALSLENYKYSSVFRDDDDEAWANRIIFVLATILSEIFQQDMLSRENWAELNTKVEEWDSAKPWMFSPLFSDPDPGKFNHGRWPELLTAHPAHAVGLQYYHICKLILAIYNPLVGKTRLTNHRLQRLIDEEVRQRMRIIIGYSISNNHVGNAMFQGPHILSTCGSYFMDREEQQAALEYLRWLQTKIGWQTRHIIADLTEQWKT